MIRWKTIHALSVGLFPLVFGSLLSLMNAGCSGGGSSRAATPPDLDGCQNLQAPVGNRVAFSVFARGVQIYRWDGATWVFQGPEAILFSDAGERTVIGSHYAGPTWESTSGSKVVGAVQDRCTPDPDAIPWLLLKANSTVGQGVFSGITFIQRVNTSGGNAPTEPGTAVDAAVRVPYTAHYFFYRDQGNGQGAR